jgi:protein-L-isoaspartate(D-aspartate) O-methyltransferase
VFRHSFHSEQSSAAGREQPAGQDQEDRFAAARRQMVAEQLAGRDITDPRVLEVMGRAARERFVPEELRGHAYEDHPLPIGLDQTISQPYIVALMVQLARPSGEDRALEVGVGSGYEAAILAGLCQQVYGIEILDELADAARQRLAALGYLGRFLRDTCCSSREPAVSLRVSGGSRVVIACNHQKYASILLKLNQHIGASILR